MAERTTVRLPEELVRQAKRKAAAEGRTLTALIEEGLRLVLLSDRKRARSKRVVLPVSNAKGGPAPGVDFTSLAELQEIEDLEYVERMKHFK
jgi:hypothetical protein